MTITQNIQVKHDDSVESEKNGSYNPYEHRNVAKPTSDLRAFANLLKSSLGTGILAIPLAYANSGWAVGIVGTFIISFICAHCVHIFVKTSIECCIKERKPLMGYAETCKAAFAHGPKKLRFLSYSASVFAEFSLVFTYLGVCCIFTILIADSIKQILDEYYPTVILKVQYYCLIIMVPLCFMVQIRHLKYLAVSSLVANILLVAIFLICLFYIFKDEINFYDKNPVGKLQRFPAFLSTVIFAMEGIGVVMPVENAMKKPQHFLGCPSVLVIAMAFITVLYAVLGLFGYFRYGDAIQAMITLNLPLDEWFATLRPAMCAKCFIALSIFLTYPLHYYVVMDIVSRYMEPHISQQYKLITHVVARCLVVIFCGGIGMALPYLEQIIGFVGALFYSILGLIIPGIVETVFRWDNLGKYKWILWKNVVIVLFGFGCLISGCLIHIMDTIEKIQSKNE